MHTRSLKIRQKPGRGREFIQAEQAGRTTCSDPLQRSGFIHATRVFHELLEQARTRSNRNGPSFCLAVFDGIRRRCLPAGELEQALVCHLRPSDNVGWIDDERLGILLPDTSEKDAYRLVHDIRTALSKEGTFPIAQVYSNCLDWPLGNRNRLHEERAKLLSVHDYSIKSDEALAFLSNQRINSESFRRPSLPIWKRAMDIGGALIALVILSPVMLTVTVLIKLVSPGPALFRQERIGMSRKPFTMLKFRTMHHNSDSAIHEQYVVELIQNARLDDVTLRKPMTKLENHPCIIPLGKVLRKTYIDEIPQLINVLRGDMSLIGPRPALAYEVQQYPEWCLARLSVPPGMTGLWQVSGKNHLSFDEMVRLDIRYVKKMSLWLDIWILLKTPITITTEIVNAISRLVCARISQKADDQH